MVELRCKVCTRLYTYSHKAGHTKEKCNSCVVNQRRIGLKKKCIEYKGGQCSKCGYKKCERALGFHHKSDDKEFGISGSHSRSWAKIKEELDKCELLCSNCHNEEHDKLDSGRSSSG